MKTVYDAHRDSVTLCSDTEVFLFVSSEESVIGAAAGSDACVLHMNSILYKQQVWAEISV